MTREEQVAFLDQMADMVEAGEASLASFGIDVPTGKIQLVLQRENVSAQDS